MTTQITGTNNIGGKKVELSFEYDTELELVTAQMRDYDTGEEVSVELILDDKIQFETFANQLKEEWM